MNKDLVNLKCTKMAYHKQTLYTNPDKCIKGKRDAHLSEMLKAGW